MGVRDSCSSAKEGRVARPSPRYKGRREAVRPGGPKTAARPKNLVISGASRRHASVWGVARGRVLIIEHEEWESALLTRLLGEAGFEVHLATEARAGFDKVRELQPDCILCNVQLPDIDGFWVARRVRTEPPRPFSF